MACTPSPVAALAVLEALTPDDEAATVEVARREVGTGNLVERGVPIGVLGPVAITTEEAPALPPSAATRKKFPAMGLPSLRVSAKSEMLKFVRDDVALWTAGAFMSNPSGWL